MGEKHRAKVQAKYDKQKARSEAAVEAAKQKQSGHPGTPKQEEKK